MLAHEDESLKLWTAYET